MCLAAHTSTCLIRLEEKVSWQAFSVSIRYLYRRILCLFEMSGFNLPVWKTWRISIYTTICTLYPTICPCRTLYCSHTGSIFAFERAIIGVMTYRAVYASRRTACARVAGGCNYVVYVYTLMVVLHFYCTIRSKIC